jgi:hypothetical protein
MRTSAHRNGLHIRTAFVDCFVCFVAKSRALWNISTTLGPYGVIHRNREPLGSDRGG